MNTDVIALTSELVAMQSVSSQSNLEVIAFIEDLLKRHEFDVERLEYEDGAGVRKGNLVAIRGSGSGGLGFLSHCDTVPGNEWDRDPWQPAVEDGKLIGLGACDMKGPLAATLVAAIQASSGELSKPVTIAVSADEEINYEGVLQIVVESELFKSRRPEFGVVAEPTELRPIYAHKGGHRIFITAHGKAAHTSTDKGVSANFLIAPFLAEMAELAKLFKSDRTFQNDEFQPPTNGFNMVIDDGGCKPNISAPKTTCTLGFRPMPNSRAEDVEKMVVERAKKYGFEISTFGFKPFRVDPNSTIIKSALSAAGADRAGTVPFGSEGAVYTDYLEAVILGPGSIAQAHTNGEWIEVAQLERAVEVYGKMIVSLCG